MSNVKTCQYPLWGAKPLARSEMMKAHNFCGAKTKTGSSYCETHHKKCNVLPDPTAPKVKWNWDSKNKRQAIGTGAANVPQPRGWGQVSE